MQIWIPNSARNGDGKSKPCQIPGCPYSAEWRVTLKIPVFNPLTKSPAKDGLIRLIMCEKHKNMVTKRDLVSEAKWAEIQRKIRGAGKEPCTWSETELEFDRLAEGA